MMVDSGRKNSGSSQNQRKSIKYSNDGEENLDFVYDPSYIWAEWKLKVQEVSINWE